MNDLELHAWISFVDVEKNFLRNLRAENYKELKEEMLKSLQDIGANKSIKVHFLYIHLEKYRDNCGDVSYEQREQFHLDIKTMEERHQDRWDKRMMADYCWSIKKNLNNMRDNQERENFYHSYYFHKGFISTVY